MLVPDEGRTMHETTEHAGQFVASSIADRLTARELDLLLSTLRGNTARQTGRLFSISHRTVETHLHSAYRKLGVHSALAAVPLLIAANLLA